MKESELGTILESIDHIIREELRPFDLYPAHIELLGRNTGVKGDKGLRGWTVVFSATKHDKSPTELQWSTLKNIEQRIVGEIQEITRVLYEIPSDN